MAFELCGMGVTVGTEAGEEERPKTDEENEAPLSRLKVALELSGTAGAFGPRAKEAGLGKEAAIEGSLDLGLSDSEVPSGTAVAVLTGAKGAGRTVSKVAIAVSKTGVAVDADKRD